MPELLSRILNDMQWPGNQDLAITNYGTKAEGLYDKEIISESHFISLMSDIGIDITNIASGSEQE